MTDQLKDHRVSRHVDTQTLFAILLDLAKTVAYQRNKSFHDSTDGLAMFV